MVEKKQGEGMRCNNLHYNYDLGECDWLFKQGIRPIGCGTHDKTGNVFIVFLVNKRYKELDKLYKQGI